MRTAGRPQRCSAAAKLQTRPLSEVLGVSKRMGSLQPLIVPWALTSGGIASIITPSAFTHSLSIPSSDLACSNTRPAQARHAAGDQRG